MWKNTLSNIPLFFLVFCFQLSVVTGNNNFMTAANQNFEIQGTVTDGTNGEPLIGVSVSIKGTLTGTATNVTGEFTLVVPDTSATLVFSYIGYIPEEIKVGDQTRFDIALMQDFVSLEEAVVIGYGVQKKSDITGAISSIDAKDIESLPVSNVTAALQGRAAGVQVVQNSGSPGSSMSMKIRGTGTINNSDPLYVVDGLVMENMDYLNPNDIEDIQILKDPASIAIYGARAANGVVLVTTKKGTVGKAKIRFSSYWGVTDFWNKPDMMDKHEYKTLYDSTHGGPTIIPAFDSDPNKSWIEQDSVYQAMLFDQFAVNDWLDKVSRKGITQKYSLQVSGGNEKTRYFFSGSLHDEKGIIQKTDLMKQTARVKIESKLSSRFTLRGNVALTHNDRSKIKEDNLGNSGEDNIFRGIISTEPHLGIYIHDRGHILLREDSTLQVVDKALGETPYTYLWALDFKDIENLYTGNIELETTLTESLKNITKAGIALTTIEGTIFHKQYNPDINQYNNIINYDFNAFEKKFTAKNKWQFQSVFTFDKSLGLHNINMVAAIDLEGFTYEELYGGKSNAPGYSPEFHSLSATSLSPYTNDDNKQWRAMGIPVRVNYNYTNKYYFQANYRADASSIFENETRWGYFPSASIGWTVSNEPFMSGFSWLSNLKLRANWGLSGNNRIKELASKNIIETRNNMTAVSGMNPQNYAGWAALGPGNPDIVWEKTNATNIGIDLGFFKSSITASLDVFNRQTSDMLLQLPQPLSTGTDEYPWQNAGEVNNKGLEAVLGIKRNIGKFNMDISANFTKIYNKVTKLGEEGNPVLGAYFSADADFLKNTFATHTAVGQPIGMFYGYQIDRSKYENGLWRQEDKDAGFPDHALPPVGKDYIFAGDVIFKDLNNDNRIDEKDKTYIGNPHPDFTYGFNIKLNYAGFDLSIFLQGLYGNDILNLERYYLYGYESDHNVISGLWDMSYQKDNEDAPYPILSQTTGSLNDNYRISDFYIEDGSYLRLKNLQIGYNFPESWLERVKVQGLRLYVGGYNLLTFTDYSGFDPEIGTKNNTFIGIDMGEYPQALTYMGGLVLDF